MVKDATVQVEALKIETKVNTPSVIYSTESQHLLISNRERCSEILRKPELSKEDRIDFLISLHLVLEIGMNGLFRRIVAANHQINNSREQIIEDLDGIGFIEKTASFIAFSKFSFSLEKDSERLRQYESLLGSLRDFAGIRNRLLHGASISETTHVDPHGQQTITRASKAAKALNDEVIQKQIRLFKFIAEALCFYTEHLDSNLTESGKKDIPKQFLDTTFLDI